MAQKKNIIEYMIGNLKIKIDRSKCLSCGSCTVIAPNTFVLDKKMICVVKEKGPYDTPKDIKEAISSCPDEAIVVEEIKS